MKMKSTVKLEITKTEYILHMDIELDNLRKAIWRTIHQFDNTTTYADKSMVLGMIQYELLHHASEHINE
jgi:hypothetical protein